MYFRNIDEVYKNYPEIENKYALAAVVGRRARMLKERKGRVIDDRTSGSYISHALEELEHNELDVGVPEQGEVNGELSKIRGPI